jgi:hypothetical protein
VAEGGTLVVSGAWPLLADDGKNLEWFGKTTVPENSFDHGKGTVMTTSLLASDDPEREDLEAVSRIGNWIEQAAGPACARIQPVGTPCWTDWAPHSGVDNSGEKGGEDCQRIRNVEQPRILASAVVQEGDGFPVLFVLNHYPEAWPFTITFGKLRPERLRCLDSGECLSVRDGTVVVDVDRKAAAVYAVEGF